MARPNKTKQIIVRLTEKERDAFFALADKMDLNVSELVRQFLRDYKGIKPQYNEVLNEKTLHHVEG